MRYFTSDWHLNEDRIGINGKPNLFYRPFNQIDEQNSAIITELVDSKFEDGDELIHLGDVVYKTDKESTVALKYIRDKYPKSKFTLILGNYDEDKFEYLSIFFDEILKDGWKLRNLFTRIINILIHSCAHGCVSAIGNGKSCISKILIQYALRKQSSIHVGYMLMQ